MVENLDELFAGLGDEGQKRLRSYLQENAFGTILAASQSLFSGVSLQTSPFYGFFRIIHLEDLTLDEATQLLTKIAQFKGDRKLASFIQTPTGRARIRAVRHLAGGNHRVYVIFSQFLTRESLDKLVEPFMRMLDDLTPYYHARMQWLSPQQRKIVEFLCERRGAVTVKDIAQRSFMSHQTASSQLKTLREMGYVQAESVGRESFYELREPLMRLSIEVKKHRDRPIQLFVDFLRLWHSPTELQQRLESLNPTALLEREYLLRAIQAAQSDTEDPRVAACSKDLNRNLNDNDYAHALEVAEELTEIRGAAEDWLVQGHCLNKLKRYHEAIQKLNKAIELDPGTPNAYIELGLSFIRLQEYEKALTPLDKAIEIDPDNVFPWSFAGVSLQALERWEAAQTFLNKAIELNPKDPATRLARSANLLMLGRWEDALISLDEVLELDPDNADAWNAKSITFRKLGRHEDALEACEKALSGSQKDSSLIFYRAFLLLELNRLDESYTALNEALTRFPGASDGAADIAADIIQHLLTKSLGAEDWRSRASKLMELYERYQAVTALGQGLVRNLTAITSPMISDSAARAWRDVWVEMAEGREELQLPVRLLDAAVRYRETKDTRVLLELPAEERAILQEALQEAPASAE